jgi:TPR repeat protein
MKRFFSVVVLVGIFFVGCAQRDVPPSKAFLFKSKSQLQVTEREALAGDNAAAKRMADYYYFAKSDRPDCIWWYKLAASRGDPVAKENLKKLLQESQ